MRTCLDTKTLLFVLGVAVIVTAVSGCVVPKAHPTITEPATSLRAPASLEAGTTKTIKWDPVEGVRYYRLRFQFQTSDGQLIKGTSTPIFSTSTKWRLPENYGARQLTPSGSGRKQIDLIPVKNPHYIFQVFAVFPEREVATTPAPYWCSGKC